MRLAWLRPGLRSKVALFVLVCGLLVSLFHQGLGFNPSSRLLTVYGLVEDGTFVADRWKDQTGDYATINHHIVSDKAPLSSFLVVPAYWAWRAAHGGPAKTRQKERDREIANHFGVAIASAFPFGLFASMTLLRVRREGLPGKRAVPLAMAAAFGSCLTNYGASYFGHMLAAALFLGCYVLAIERERGFVFAGLLGGLSVLAEYPLGLLQVLIGFYLLTGPDRLRRVFLYGLGAGPCAIALLGYNRLVTGKYFDFPYNHVPEQWAAMRTAFGMRLPSPEALWELLFGQYRGLAFYAPALLLAVPLILRAFAGPRRRRNFVMLVMAAHVLLISSYFMWDGGWCTGPRHLAPVIALGLYEGAAAVARRPRNRLVFMLLSLGGAILSLTATATNPMPSQDKRTPAFQIFFPDLFAGKMNNHNFVHELGLDTSAPWVLGAQVGLILLATLFFAWLFQERLRKTPHQRA